MAFFKRCVRPLKTLIYTLAAGYVLFFYSERLFWSSFRPTDSVADCIITWLAYSAVTYLFLAVVKYFHAHTSPSVFIAGAIYGWLVEGGIACTLYGTEPSAPWPLSLLCTGVSWHAAISVLLGWHAMRGAIRDGNSLKLLGMSVGLGLFWGLWAPFLWYESPPVVLTVSGFLTSGLVFTALLIFCYTLLDWMGEDAFKPGAVGLSMAAIMILLFYSQHVMNLGNIALMVLPTLLIFALALLQLNRGREAEANPGAKNGSRCGWRLCPLIFAAPFTAAAVYALALSAASLWKPIHPTLYRITIIIGGLLLVWSALKVCRPGLLKWQPGFGSVILWRNRRGGR